MCWRVRHIFIKCVQLSNELWVSWEKEVLFLSTENCRMSHPFFYALSSLLIASWKKFKSGLCKPMCIVNTWPFNKNRFYKFTENIFELKFSVYHIQGETETILLCLLFFNLNLDLLLMRWIETLAFVLKFLPFIEQP